MYNFSSHTVMIIEMFHLPAEQIFGRRLCTIKINR
jgi:hypothetical protein